jgi:hypothetical protein
MEAAASGILKPRATDANSPNKQPREERRDPEKTPAGGWVPCVGGCGAFLAWIETHFPITPRKSVGFFFGTPFAFPPLLTGDTAAALAGFFPFATAFKYDSGQSLSNLAQGVRMLAT